MVIRRYGERSGSGNHLLTDGQAVTPPPASPLNSAIWLISPAGMVNHDLHGPWDRSVGAG
jgi:hypothetical protein